MTNLEHRQKAEELLASYKEVLEHAKVEVRGVPAHEQGEALKGALEMATSLLMQAQVHATLSTGIGS